jgi:hypothetical protein
MGADGVIAGVVTGVIGLGGNEYPAKRRWQPGNAGLACPGVAPGPILPTPPAGWRRDDDLAERPGNGLARGQWSRTARGTNPGHGQGLSPRPDHDDPPLAGLIGHGGLRQIPGHGRGDRAEPPQLTWPAGQAGQRAPRHAELGSSLEQLADRLRVQRSLARSGELTQGGDTRPGTSRGVGAAPGWLVIEGGRAAITASVTGIRATGAGRVVLATAAGTRSRIVL